MNTIKNKKNEIIDLYTLYKFEKEKILDNILVFSYSQGYFNNVEIVFDKETSELNSLEEDYKACGYAVIKRLFVSLEDIHKNLFKGFFKPDVQKRRLKNQYLKFEETRNKALLDNCKYSYIPCSYVLNGSEHDEGLIDFLSKKIKEDSSSLTFLEAAAGFGKTCTTYELMNNLLQTDFNENIPLFIELSKNRSAKVFRYVLLDEIDITFGGMESNLVIKEIRNGRIPLVIDGFDELLSDNSINEDTKSYINEKNQTMINTILELFSKDSKTKIIITSRKTAFRMGNVYDSVLERMTCNTDLNQITLGEPNITKWLDSEKRALLNNLSIPLENFVNPIMLSYLKSIDISKLNTFDLSYEKLVNDYIERVLTREMERQSLVFTAKEQRDIYIYLASFFISFHISSDEPNFIYGLLQDILKEHYDMNEKISLYTSFEEKPSEKQIITKLSHHALLDTNTSQKQYIGFLNDFVAGLFMGFVILENKLQEDKILLTDIELDKICSAFYPMEIRTKEKLYQGIRENILINEEEVKLHLDSVLLGKLSKNYNGLNIDSEVFNNFSFTEFNIENSFFADCRFINCDLSLIKNSQFCNCYFYSDNQTSIDKNNNNIFIMCEGITEVEIESTIENNTRNYKKEVLEQFWQKGREHAELRRWPKTLYRGFEIKDYSHIDKAIDELKQEDILLWTGLCYLLNLEKISEIKIILGR